MYESGLRDRSADFEVLEADLDRCVGGAYACQLTGSLWPGLRVVRQ